MGNWPQRYPRSVAVLTTMHGKESVIGPILERDLGVVVGLALGVDTDRFGTFTREYARAGSQLDAARAKVRAGFDYAPLARIGLASEGSFGPHPSAPFLPIARELILFVDRAANLEIVGQDVSVDTNYRHAVVTGVDEALAFGKRIGFPSHGVIVSSAFPEGPRPDAKPIKDIATGEDFVATLEGLLSESGSVFLESDMRASRNPTRRAAIERATIDLVRRFRSRCPRCGCPGWDVVERLTGLPCRECGGGTLELRAEVSRCRACNRSRTVDLTTTRLGQPAACPVCNP
jgi:hypothetical protein